MLSTKIATGLGMIVLTIIIHSIFTASGAKVAHWHRNRFGPEGTELRKAIMISILVIWLSLAVVLEVLLWALLYLFIPVITELPDLETAFYFSMVTFTTLGFGDVVLTGHWRTLASIQAVNGVIIFGWTTALIFYFIQHLYQRD